ERAPAGADEPRRLGGAHRLHPRGHHQLVHRVEVDPGLRPVRRRRELDGASTRSQAPPGQIRLVSFFDDGIPSDDEVIDDARAEVAPHHAVETEALLARVIEIVENAPRMPLSASSMISKEEVLDLLDEAVNRLPEEL